MTPGNLCVMVHPMTGNDRAGGLVDRAGSTQGRSDKKVELGPKRSALRSPERMQSRGLGL